LQVKDCRYNAVLFLASFHSPEAVFQQLPVIYALPSYGARSLTVVVPYYPTGTMERITHVGEVATAKSLARMISATPMAANGPSQFAIFDIHALQEQVWLR
jgi:phosphoribosylpyrophosphate synthetase